MSFHVKPPLLAGIASAPTLAGFFIRSVVSTEMMGATEAAVRIPKPSVACARAQARVRAATARARGGAVRAQARAEGPGAERGTGPNFGRLMAARRQNGCAAGRARCRLQLCAAAGDINCAVLRFGRGRDRLAPQQQARAGFVGAVDRGCRTAHCAGRDRRGFQPWPGPGRGGGPAGTW